MSSAVEQLALVVVAALPVSYVCSKKATREVKLLLVLLEWTTCLLIPLWNDLPIHTAGTMMLVVVTFTAPSNLTQLLLFPWDNGSSKKNNDDRKSTTTMNLYDFFQFTGSFFYYFLPVSTVKAPRPDWATVVRRNIEYVLVIALKLIVHPLSDRYARSLLNDDQEVTVVLHTKLLLAFLTGVLAGTWVMDLQCVLINLVSLSRLEMLPFNNYPLWSTSLRDLWGRRYNLLMNCFFKDTVYIPAQNYWNCTKSTAAFLCFVASGILHSWVAYHTFQTGVARALVFFLLQPLWIIKVETTDWYQQRVTSKRARGFLALLFFFVTLPLYAGLFVEAMPDWLEKNPATVPHIPILSHATDVLASWMDLPDMEPVVA